MLDELLERSLEKKHIISSLSDLDFYKLTMGQMVFNRHKDVPVKYALKNRTKGVCLAEHIKEVDLMDELDHVRDLIRFGNSELHFLRGTNEYSERMFKEPYLDFLRNLKLPVYALKIVDGDYCLEFSGSWSEAIYWETIALSIVNELYYRSLMRNLSRFQRKAIFAEGTVRLAKKIEVLKKRPDITFSEFGTRRRFSGPWQDYVVEALANELSPRQFLGTSNVYLADKYSLLPMGTAAHELYMVYSGIYHANEVEIFSSHNRVLQDWWQEYGWGLSIALTDTYGSDFFFRDMTAEQAKDWKGLRHDSRDPLSFGEKAIKFYQQHSIDPREKIIVFSDGLDLDTIIKIADRFRGRIKVTFGWGTNLTNDLGFKSLSLIVKAVESCGHGTVKLSDNLAKAMGDPADILMWKRLAKYGVSNFEECKY